MNVIYAYRKKSTDKIVYVGQTIDLPTRHKTHMQYDPFNVSTREYNYPLSRGIRKYGENEYELVVLEENVPKDLLNEREKYWIKYYDTCFNGYNQTIGGTYPAKPVFDEQTVDQVINMLRDESYSYNDISEKTGVSMTHIYNINIGARRPQSNIVYPIRKSNTKGTKGLKFSPEECVKIHEEILKNDKTFLQIAQNFGCSKRTIVDINRGQTKNYRLDNYDYPLRDTHTARSLSKKIFWQNK